ncbi:hypothetical protein EV714DRAFT_238708 [Schizophyllum commune]
MRTSGQHTKLADASKQLFRNRTSLTDSEPLTSEDQRSYNCIKSLLPSGQIFPTLRVDPPSFSNTPPPALFVKNTRAEQELYTLNVILTLGNDSILPDAHTAALRPRVERQVGEMWYTLIPWLEHLLENRDERPLDSIQDIIRSQLIPYLFCHKRALRALLLETPQLYRIFLDTWLHFDTYYPDPAAFPDRRAAFGQVLRIIYQHALWSDGGVGDCEGGKASDADPFALDCLLSAVKRRPRRLYRHAVRQASRFARPGDALETLQMDLKLICELAGTLIPIPNHARDVILAVVDILRELDTLGTREAAAAAADGCFLLLKMWSSERSHERGRRAMTWALRAGALPLMRGIYSREPDRVIAHALESIASHAIYVDVLRAVAVGANPYNSQGSLVLGFADEATERCISTRLALRAPRMLV